jgi:GNAT superfamily N-acetyltransferase
MKFRFVSFGEIEDLPAHHPQLRNRSQLISSDLNKNPHIENDFPVFCYMHDDDKVLAHFSSFPDCVYYQKNKYNWAWCGNLYTDPEYRGKGIASALVKNQAALFHSKNLAWGGVFSTPAALRIYDRLGFSVLGYAPRYLLIKNVGPLIRHHIANSLVVRAAEHTYGIFLHSLRRIVHDEREFFGNYTVHIEELAIANSKYSLENIKYSERYHFDDSEAMARWKMQTRNIDQLYIVSSRRTGKPSCYLIIRSRRINKKALLERYKDIKLMTVMDYGRFDLDPAICDAIISGIMSVFFTSNADACELICSDENICRSARRHGMMRVGMGMSFAYSRPASWKLGSECGDMHQWHLTHYRGDAFAFE